jgi:hypothetical protein
MYEIVEQDGNRTYIDHDETLLLRIRNHFYQQGISCIVQRNGNVVGGVNVTSGMVTWYLNLSGQREQGGQP